MVLSLIAGFMRVVKARGQSELAAAHALRTSALIYRAVPDRRLTINTTRLFVWVRMCHDPHPGEVRATPPTLKR